MIRVVLADDHAIVREGIKALLRRQTDLAIVAEAENGMAALDVVTRVRPDLLIADLTMPLLNGVALIERVRAQAPDTRVLVLSMHAAPEFVRPALRAGALGYLVKGAGLDELIPAVRAVARGERFLDARAAAVIAHDALESSPHDDDLQRLTAREREVLQLVAEGATNREVGERLGLSPKTVDVHRTNLMRKLDLHSAQALTRYAVRRGLISSE